MPRTTALLLVALLAAIGPTRCSAADRVVFLRSGPRRGHLYVASADGTADRPLTQPGSLDYNPAWSLKGDWIAFTSERGSSADTRGNLAHLAWSPDGEQLLFTSSRMGFKDEAIYTGALQPDREVFVMRYDGTHVEQLTDNQWEDGGPAWQLQPPRSAALTTTATEGRHVRTLVTEADPSS